MGHFDPDKAQSVPAAEAIKYVLPLPRDRQGKKRQLCDLSKILNRMYSQGSFFKSSLIFWLHEPRVTL